MKPLVVFDLETTGLDRTKDQIIQFAAIKIVDDKIVDKLNLYIQPVGNYTIDIAAYFKHHIKPEFLADKPHIYEVAQQIIDFFGDCDILGYNSCKFDMAFLIHELEKYAFHIDFTNRNCYDSFLEETRRDSHMLERVYAKYYGKTMEENGLEAHNAFSDVQATYEVFKAQNAVAPVNPEHMYGEDNIVKDIEFRGEVKPCFSIGKYRGVSLEYVAQFDQNYLQWCISDKCNFMPNTKKYISQYVA